MHWLGTSAWKTMKGPEEGNPGMIEKWLCLTGALWQCKKAEKQVNLGEFSDGQKRAALLEQG